ncbi:MAG: M20/M25/M40 family metallo-hydrolase [Acidimicrobiia bacterium]|nr:M20/M25/M40 family metallo-hydrolase [Acidimicrobiia bacterium]MDH3463803.1 M20/M25/M40 family metallo-hydrolase [Acidimicrobiia bacterium]
MHQHLKAAVAEDMSRLKGILSDLIRIPSISAPGFDPNDVRAAAGHIVTILEGQGFANAQLLEAENGNPAVFAEIPGPEGAPTVLLYAHYDVQPPGPVEEWETQPFEPVEKDGRLYGRGASDDKAGVVMHIGAVAAHGDSLPVGVQIFFEGEEEAGSVSLEELLKKYSHLLHPDVIVIGDGGNWAVGIPALLTSLRGLASVTFELRTLKAAVHSGQYGGVFPDALSAMSRLLATLYDDHGNVAIPGLVSEESDGLDISPEMARSLAGAIDGVHEIGSGSVPARLWTKPSVSVLAIDAPPVNGAINQLVPVSRTKVSLRIAPGENSKNALAKLKSHLTENVPWGAQLTFLHEESGESSTLETDNFAVRAWEEAFAEAFGQETVHMGAGGSIPFIATFAELFPGAPILVTGCGDPTSAYHAPNESQHIGDLEKSVLAEAIALSLLAQPEKSA